VPRVLTIDQKQQRFDDSEQCLAIFNRYKDGNRQSTESGLNASVFWDARGIIFICYLEKDQTINSENYIVLLERLNDEIKKKQHHLKKKKVFH
jgi:hypothetical protein